MQKQCYRLLVTLRMCQECGVSCCRLFLKKRTMWRRFSINWMFAAEAEPAHHKRVKRHFHIYVEEEHSPLQCIIWALVEYHRTCNNQLWNCNQSPMDHHLQSLFLFYLDQWLSMVCCAVNTKLAEPFMHLCMIAISGVHRTCCNVNVTAFIHNVIVHLTALKSSFSTF